MHTTDTPMPELKLCPIGRDTATGSGSTALHQPEVTSLCRGMQVLVVATDPSTRFRLMVMVQALEAVGLPETSLQSAKYSDMMDYMLVDAVLIVLSETTDFSQLDGALLQLRKLGFEGTYFCLLSAGESSRAPITSGCQYLSWPMSIHALGEALVATRPADQMATMTEQLSCEAKETVTSDLAWCSTTAFMLSRFVENLPRRLEALQEALRSRDFSDLQKLTHQLKTSATSHGYRPVSMAVQEIEALLEEQNEHMDQTQDDLNKVTDAIEELTQLCQRVSHLPGHDTDDLPTGA